MKDVLADLPGYALRRASSATLAELATALEPIELRPTDASLLVLIAANPGITPSRLGAALGIQRANMVPLIGRMEERDLIARTARDGRSFGLNLTDHGTKLCAEVSKIIDAHEQRIMNLIPEAHRPHFLQALRLLWSA